MSTPNFSAPVINPFGLTDVQAFASPDFVDIDGDGDLDVFVGQSGGNTFFYENTGDASSPTLAAPVANPFGLGNVGFSASPTFADIDGDGDFDAFIGQNTGNTFFFENTGDASSPTFATRITNPFGLTNLGFFSNPTFADIDGDGDLDAFVGANPSIGANGSTFFFENTGDASSPSFAAPVTNPFGLTEIPGNRTAPTFADIDGDGDLDAFVGGNDGNTQYYENTGDASNPSFAAPVTNAFGLTDAIFSSSPDLVDIDGDGDLDAFVGNNEGNTFFYENIPVVANQPPVANDDSITTDEDTAVTGDVLANDSDADSDPLTVTEVNGEAADVGSQVTLPSGALLTLNGDGTFDYDPNGAFESLGSGDTDTDSFTYTLSDGTDTSTATVTVTIDGADDVPTPGDDVLTGTSGNDFILALPGNDLVNAGDGDDTVGGGDGDDTIDGGAGNDVIRGWTGRDSIDGGAGADNLQGGPNPDTLNGGDDDDSLDGGTGADILNGDAGDDFIAGRNGNDFLTGGLGADDLRGGNGQDTLDGGDDDDALHGGRNDDSLTGSVGSDFLDGEAGNDILIGVDSSAAAPGSGELDSLRGGSGADTFILGDATTAYYLGGGDADYARIRTFNPAEDTIQLSGSEADYTLNIIGQDTEILQGGDRVAFLINDRIGDFSSGFSFV